MRNKSVAILFAVAVSLLSLSNCYAQGNNLLPKYGPEPKSEAQHAADKEFLSIIDEHYKGDRTRASEEIAMRGWQFLSQGKMDDAMKRFNQAWLLENTNGKAIWGMAVIRARAGKSPEALKLFAEAEPLVLSDINFAVDYAKTIGFAGAQARDEALLKEAFTRFTRIYERAPDHIQNLQNWAITLFYAGDYAESWRKVMLAEKTAKPSDLDPSFVAALENKMPRP